MKKANQNHGRPNSRYRVPLPASTPLVVVSNNKSKDASSISPILPPPQSVINTCQRPYANANLHFSTVEASINSSMANNTMNQHNFASTMIQQPCFGGMNNSRPGASFSEICNIKLHNPTSTLFAKLKILQSLRLLEIEEERDKTQNKHKEKDVSSCYFEFPEDCFSSGQNSTASFHLFHLLFECYNSKEAEEKFRDVWPIHDKKMESSFRKVVSVWIRKIISEHESFFRHIKIDAISGLLVNPGGERFVLLSECFTNLVSLSVLNRNDELAGECSCIHIPMYYGNSSITERQILLLIKHSINLAASTAFTRKQMLKTLDHCEKIMQKLAYREQIFQAYVNDVQNRKQCALELIKNMDIDESLQNLQVDFVETLRPTLHSEEEVDALFQKFSGLDNYLKIQKEKIYQAENFVEMFMNKYKVVWHVMGLSSFQKRVLDVDKLFVIKNPSLSAFLQTIRELVESLMKDERLNQLIAEERFIEFKAVVDKFKCLKFVHESLKSEIVGKQYFETRNYAITKPPTDENQWSIISNITIPPLQNWSLLVERPKHFEFEARTGYTPRLVKFLQSKKEGKSEMLRSIKSVRSKRIYTGSMVESKTEATEDLPDKSIIVETTPSPASELMESPISRFTGSCQIPSIQITRLNINTPPNGVNVTVPQDHTSEDESDCSESSDSATPVELDNSVQTRIAQIMSYLCTPNQSANSSFVSEFGKIDSTNCSRRSSFVLPKRVSLGCSNNSDNNKSLVEYWNDEKGIMDMSSGSLWMNNMSDDES